MKIGIIVAMDKEFVQLQEVVKTFDKHEFILQKCGIGKVNAAIGTAEMIAEHHPDLIISSGCAGGADTTLNITDVVVGTSYVYHDAYCGKACEYGQILGQPARFETPEALVGKALGIEGANIRAGLIVTGDWFVDSRDKMREIMGHFPQAQAVDMESCAIAQTCHKYGVPFVSFRIISDVPLSDHEASQYFDFWDRLADNSFGVTKRFLETL